MGKTTIEWATDVWNPVRGCSRVSEGCRNCYAERQAARFAAPGIGVLGEEGAIPSERPAAYKAGPFYGFVTKVNGHAAWTGKVELVESHLLDPLKWKEPKRIFVNSMSDLFHENLSDEAIDQVFAVMALCPQHTFLILTKRPKRMLEYFRTIPFGGHDGAHDSRQYRVVLAIRDIADKYKSVERDNLILPRWPLPNVWLGVSVEDRAHKSRIDSLREIPAAIRFLSIEPLLEDIGDLDLRGIHWVIVGGESGPGAREFDIEWAIDIRDQCARQGVAFFCKQLGAFPVTAHCGILYDTEFPRGTKFEDIPGDTRQRVRLGDKKGGEWSQWPGGLRVRSFPGTM